MATIKLLLGIICFAFVGRNGMLGGRVLTGNSAAETQLRTKLVRIALKELGTREKTGKNDGERIKQYLRMVKLEVGQPYCAAFVSWVFAEAGAAKPRTGWSPDLFPGVRLARSALPGNVLGIYFQQYGRIAHVGLIIRQDGDYLISVEGNTNLAGSREGEGVYLKRRHIRTIYKIADWVKERDRP